MNTPLLFAFLLLSLFQSATGQNFQWARDVDGPGSLYGVHSRSIVTGITGNVYTTGYFQGPVQFDNNALSGFDSADVFLSKYDTNGNCIWAQQAGGIRADFGWSLDVDSSENIYVAGYFMDTAVFGSFTVVSNGQFDAFLAKYDSSGNCSWVRRGGGVSYDYANSVDVDKYGNAYVTGSFTDTAFFFGSTMSIYSTYRSVYLAKINSFGNLVWLKRSSSQCPTCGSGQALEVHLKEENEPYVFVGGDFSGILQFESNTVSGMGCFDGFVAKFDTAGNSLWLRALGGADFDKVLGISTDFAGECYVTGSFGLTANFGGFQLTSLPNYQKDGFVMNYDGNGTVEWVKQISGNWNEELTGIESDSAGNCFVAGHGSSDTILINTSYLFSNIYNYSNAFVSRFDRDGVTNWVLYPTAISPNGYVYCYGITEESGTMYMSGFQGGTNLFSSIMLNGNTQDMMIAKIINASLVNSVSTVNQELNLTVFPNPSSGLFDLIIQNLNNEELSVSVVDVTGRIIMSKDYGTMNGTLQESLNLANYSSGVYYLQIKRGSRIQYVKMSKI